MPVADSGEVMSFDSEQLKFVPNARLQSRTVKKVFKKLVSLTQFYDED
jgi:hypothetical protein